MSVSSDTLFWKLCTTGGAFTVDEENWIGMSIVYGARRTPITIPYASRGAVRMRSAIRASRESGSIFSKPLLLQRKTASALFPADAAVRNRYRIGFVGLSEPVRSGPSRQRHASDAVVLAVRLPAAGHLPALQLDGELEHAALEDLVTDEDRLRDESRRRIERLLQHRVDARSGRTRRDVHVGKDVRPEGLVIDAERFEHRGLVHGVLHYELHPDGDASLEETRRLDGPVHLTAAPVALPPETAPGDGREVEVARRVEDAVVAGVQGEQSRTADAAHSPEVDRQEDRRRVLASVGRVDRGDELNDGDFA